MVTLEEKKKALGKRWNELGLGNDTNTSSPGGAQYFLQGFPTPRVVTSCRQSEHYTEQMIRLVKRGNLTADEHAYLELLGTLADTFDAQSKEIRDREL